MGRRPKKRGLRGIFILGLKHKLEDPVHVPRMPHCKKKEVFLLDREPQSINFISFSGSLSFSTHWALMLAAFKIGSHIKYHPRLTIPADKTAHGAFWRFLPCKLRSPPIFPPQPGSTLHLPSLWSMISTKEVPEPLTTVEALPGAKRSSLALTLVLLPAQMPRMVNWPQRLLWAKGSRGWSARDIWALARGIPSALRTLPESVWLGQMQPVQSLLGMPMAQLSWQAKKREPRGCIKSQGLLEKGCHVSD